MKNAFIMFATVALALVITPAYAGVCDGIAARYAANNGASVLRVSDTGSACRVTVLVRNGNKAPRRKTVTLRK